MSATTAQMAAWPAPNYINPSTMTVPTICVTTLATIIMLPCVISRLHFRMRLKGTLGVDDYVIISAAVSQVAVEIRTANFADLKGTFRQLRDSGDVRDAMGLRIPPLGHQAGMGCNI